MGGVLPEHRRKGIANRLSKNQEDWIIKMEIKKIRFKTQNKFKGMLIFALKNGFSILGTVPFEGVEGFKILLEKKLL
jgi:GNAT superfamily N-acetyltransferase